MYEFRLLFPPLSTAHNGTVNGTTLTAFTTVRSVVTLLLLCLAGPGETSRGCRIAPGVNFSK